MAQACVGFGVLITSSVLEMWGWGCGDGMEKEGVGPLGTAGDAEGANIPIVVPQGDQEDSATSVHSFCRPSALHFFPKIQV